MFAAIKILKQTLVKMIEDIYAISNITVNPYVRSVKL